MADRNLPERRSLHQHCLSREESAQLCSRCADIDIGQLWSSTGTKISLGTISDWDIHSCLFCKFMNDVLSPTHPHQEQVPEIETEYESQASCPYYLYSMRSRESSERLLQLLERRIIVLSSSEHGPPPKGVPYIAVHPTKPPFWLRQIPPLLDFGQLKNWLDMCHQLHAEYCGGEQERTVANLKFIDCSTEKVIKGEEDEPYVALSYVWGFKGTLRQTPSGYPQTIQDAITLTRKLGFTRLWVDKYCIDQEDQLETQKQLQQMDAIYKHAVVTIIAASGTDEDYGLPGVSTRLRSPTSSVTVRQQTLSAIRGAPDLWSDKCKWASRAWTYQEGLLSTRRLVFTDDQVYFECQGLYCTEMLDIPLNIWKQMHHHQQPYLHSLYREAPHMGKFPLDGCGVDPWDICNRISEYSKRSLSHQTDILKGMLGIFGAFERGKNSMRHLCGIPFPKMAKSSPNQSTFETGSKRTMPTFSESLRWTLGAPSERREGFPSWSWTGWFGEIRWPPEYASSPRTLRKIQRPHDPKINERAIRVEIELCDDTTINWETFQTRYNQLLTFGELSGYIQIEAYTTPVIYLDEDGSSNMNMSVRYQDGQTITLPVERTTNLNFKTQNLSPDSFLAIHFCRTISGNRGKSNRIAVDRGGVKVKQHIIIVWNMGSHWERVASGTYVVEAQKNLDRQWQRLRLG
ncbi:HET-domain-containing protein [Amniculicola lignicola CBS 123094]|uniref:HET-domain-containing protein n=1 Tax=Amniculicola lignicola CBS 123094 TaxID=1392246 RepID=A0A6A5WAU7_9PLEO|nr:HET-domain-containing protein [Amniculicola lignicola CBS 123094]